MSTGIIVLIVVVVLVLVALLVALPRLRAAQEEKRLQNQRKEVAGRHHAEADEKVAHAEEIERRAEADRAEAELAERQAEARRAEVDLAQRKAEAVRAEADVSRSAADRTEQGLADDEIGLGRDEDRTAAYRTDEPVGDGVQHDGVVRDEPVVREERTGSLEADPRRDRPA